VVEFKVINRFDDYQKTGIGYEVELVERGSEYIGRLIVDFPKGKRRGQGRAFYLETYYNDFIVSEILKMPYDGRAFQGYENLTVEFQELKTIYVNQKTDWKAALENIKGVYVIFDKSTGKKYVGSAYGLSGIWTRWGEYMATGDGNNRELSELISKNGIKYACDNFVFTLLEYRPMKTDDSVIIDREKFWKKALLAKGEFGYNKN